MWGDLVPYVLANVFACAGAGFAGVAGFCGWLAFDRWNRKRIHRESIKDFANNSDALMPKCGRHVSVNAIVLSIMEEESRKISLGKSKRVCPSVFSKSKFFTNAIKKAGLTAEVTEEGFTEIRAKLALGLGIVFASFGFLLSFGFAIFLLITGAVIGWSLFFMV